jgi:phospholipid transport system substrate-binding protein
MKKSFLVVLGCFFLLASLPAWVWAAAGPTEQLRPTLAKLTRLLADSDLKGDAKKKERREKIMSSIMIGFDFKEMSQRILGQTWNEITSAEQDRFTGLMTKLLENVYIGKLESYSGQTIGYVGERVKEDRAQVSTMVEDKGQKIPVHYIMTLVGEKWMVYDINIEGVSLVRNYMEQFKSILRTEKFAGLIKVLEEKNRSFETGGNSKEKLQ